MVYLLDPVFQLISLIVAFAAVHLFANGRRFIFAAHTALFISLTAVLISHGIQPYSSAENPAGISVRFFFGAAKATWWIGGSLMLVSFVRLFLSFEGRPRDARLAQDLMAGVIYVGAALSVVAYVFNVPVGTLIATSGVIAVILGLALQSTLSDVFSGVALNLGRPYSVGDWIVLDGGVQGRVVETNWRATHLLNGTNDLVVIPNSTLAKSQLVNQSSPDETHGVTLSVRVITSQTPSQIQQLFEIILLGSRKVLRGPSPLVSLSELDGQSVLVEVTFRVSDAGRIIAAKNEILDLIFRHVKAAGLELAVTVPTGSIAPIGAESSHRKMPHHELIRTAPLFAALTSDELELLTENMVERDYHRDAEIVHQGRKSPTLMFIGKGVVVVERDVNGKRLELNRLSPGDFFGERGLLMGAEEPGSIRALTHVAVLEISSESIAKLMRGRPTFADELGATLSARLEAEMTTEGGIVSATHGPVSIAHRIRRLFEIKSPNNN